MTVFIIIMGVAVAVAGLYCFIAENKKNKNN